MVAALALAGAACGGDDDSTATDDASATSDAPGDEGGDADNADEGGDSDEQNEWCTQMQEAEPEFDDLDITDPESVENAFGEIVNVLDEMADSAPDEIEDDVKILSDQFKTFFDKLEDADFDITKIDQTELDNAEADAASERIDEFCGLDPDAGEIVTDDTASTVGTATDDSDDALSGDLRDQTIDQLTAVGLTEDQAGCIVDNVDDLEDFAQTGAADPTAFLALVETCDIDLTQLTPPGVTTGG